MKLTSKIHTISYHTHATRDGSEYLDFIRGQKGPFKNYVDKQGEEGLIKLKDDIYSEMKA